MADSAERIANRERILNDFIDFISIDSPSLRERRMADMLRGKLAAIGFDVYEDDAGVKAGGDSGNLIAVLRGDPDMPSVALLAHMDTVNPCENKRWIVDGDTVRTDGNTILGADDGAGVVAALEIARRVLEEQLRRGDIFIIYTICEETGLLGAKLLNHDVVKSAASNGALPQFCFVFDSGSPPGSVVARAPSHMDLKITVRGAAAHAGIEPEKGINAIAVASEAIAAMPLGRIDFETTANIGIIKGGLARNIVCETVYIDGEARSHDRGKLAEQTAKMKACVDAACARRNARYDFVETLEYEAFALNAGDPVIDLLTRAAKALGGELSLVPTGGGSDANILNAIGVPAANLPVGMHNAHSTSEYADLRETAGTIELVVSAFRILTGVTV